MPPDVQSIFKVSQQPGTTSGQLNTNPPPDATSGQAGTNFPPGTNLPPALQNNFSDDDSPEALSKACGASITIVACGDIIGFAQVGMLYEALIMEGKPGNERYRLVPSKAVSDFKTTDSLDLVKGQRAIKSPGMIPDMGSKDVLTIKAVARRDSLGTVDRHPLEALAPKLKGERMSVTRVLIQ